MRTFTIIATSGNQHLRPLHDRMPVILAPDDYPAWLGEDSALKPYAANAMRAYPVSPIVNSPKNDRPECIEPPA